MKQKKSLAYNSAKKRKILIGCAIVSTAVLMAGTGIGIGYLIWYKKNSPSEHDVITFATTHAMKYGEPEQTISATSSLDKTITLSATDDLNGPNNIWYHFNPTTGGLHYNNPVSERTTVTITADDGITRQKAYVDLYPSDPTPPEPVYNYETTSNYLYLQFSGTNNHPSVDLTTTLNGNDVTRQITYAFVGSKPDCLDDIDGNTLTMNDDADAQISVEISASITTSSGPQIVDTITLIVWPKDAIPSKSFVMSTAGYLQEKNFTNGIAITLTPTDDLDPSNFSITTDQDEDDDVNVAGTGASWVVKLKSDSSLKGGDQIKIIAKNSDTPIEVSAIFTIHQPTIITTALVFNSSNILDLDDADSEVEATVTCTSVDDARLPTPTWSVDSNPNTTLSIDSNSGGQWTNGVQNFTIKNNSQIDTGHFSITCTIDVDAQTYDSSPADLNIVNEYVFTPVPVTTTYFNFNGTTDTISGFSQAVIDDYADNGSKTMLSKFDTIDLCHSPVKYMAANAYFGKSSSSATGNVFDIWKIRQLNLSGVKFHFNSSGQSGYRTFRYCNFNKLIDLNLANTDFASCIATDFTSYSGNVNTAYQTFNYTQFIALKTLNLSGVIFAVSNMTYSTASSNITATASQTFERATFTNLQTLNLSGAIFAATHMNASNTYNQTYIYTASQTFYYAIFTNLQTLNLSGAVFAIADMFVSSTQIQMFAYIARNTFERATFTALEELDLSGAVFAIAGMTIGGNISSASQTFYYATFPNLQTLNLSGANFVAANMTNTGVCNIAYNTFENDTFTALEELNLSGAVFAVENMTKTSTITTAMYTFQRSTFTVLKTLNLSGAIFAAANATTNSINPASNTFYQTKFGTLNTLSLGAIQLQNGSTYTTNTISTNCFNNLTDKPWDSSKKLAITGSWNKSNWASQFNAWFIDDTCWSYN